MEDVPGGWDRVGSMMCKRWLSCERTAVAETTCAPVPYHPATLSIAFRSGNKYTFMTPTFPLFSQGGHLLIGRPWDGGEIHADTVCQVYCNVAPRH